MKDLGSQMWRGRFYAYAPLVVWIGVIFYLSSDQGSMSQTSRFIRPLLEFLFPAAPEETLQIYHGYVRKAAHFTEYAVLAFLALRALSARSIRGARLSVFIFTFGIVAGIAMLDELNQSFESSRSGSVWDILLDISGGAAMILFLWLVKGRRSPTGVVKM